MQAVRIGMICTLVAMMLGIGSCAPKVDYIVKGLKLPPGSTGELIQYADQVDGYATSPFVKDYSCLTVDFDNSSGWQAVVTHFDRSLLNQGFEVRNFTYVEGLTGAAVWPDIREYCESKDTGFRVYRNDETKTTVTIGDFTEVTDHYAKKGEYYAQFMLSVAQKN